MYNIFETEDLIKYPFIEEAREYVKNKGLSIEDVFSTSELKPILKRAYERIIDAINKGIVPYKKIDPSLMDEEILSFPTAILIISIVGNDQLAYKYAVAESKKAEKLFKKETPEKLIYIGRSLNWDTDIEEINGTKYLLINVITYISLASSLSGENWSLSMQTLSKGYVKLLPRDYARLLSEGVKQHILNLFNPIVNVNYSGATEYIEELIRISGEKFKQSYSTTELKNVKETFYPPCIRVMLGELMAGKNPPHLARFSIVTFLRSVGWNSEDVIKLFTRVADFNERITRYQVEHIYGLRGSKTVYNMPSCSTLKAANICYAGDDPICAKIRHPLQYVRISYKKGEEHEPKGVE
ncbi:MAG: DNA primase large subunit PriL [Thermoprotei archaeon]